MVPKKGRRRGDEFVNNILTLDSEDWQQSTLDQNLPTSDRGMLNANRVLDILSEHGAHCPFLVQLLVAEDIPNLYDVSPGKVTKSLHTATFMDRCSDSLRATSPRI